MNGRYAPSPTGDLHLGNLRTALLAWLFARSAGSRFSMRMEDLDAGRVRAGFYDSQLRDLAAIGIDWDGEVIRQSDRLDLYAEALARLDTYECFCTRAEIREAVSAPHGTPGRYPGTCRDAPPRGGRPPALRLRSHDPAVDDVVLRRNDGAFAYNLAVVVDDAAQGVEQVVRGADLADQAPVQAYIARALGLPVPVYEHVPLVLGPDGSRLAKRHGAVTLRDLSPQAARRWILDSLGWTDADPATFDPSRIPRDPSTYVG